MTITSVVAYPVPEQAYAPAITSVSLGRASHHTLQSKLSQAMAHNFPGIEIFWEDLESFTSTMPGGKTTNNFLEAARIIKDMCHDSETGKTIKIVNLQPFYHYEGLKDRQEHAKRIELAQLWFRIIKVFETNLISIPSNFLPSSQVSDSHSLIVSDLQELADLGAMEDPPVRLAYENLCWGTVVRSWEEAWSVVRDVDRNNFGICLDTFNVVGAEWADPTSVTGKIAGSVEDVDVTFARSLKKMVATIPASKIFALQLVDAEFMSPPITPQHSFHVDGQDAKMSWSRNARLFPFEAGGYLPVLDVLKAITRSREDGGIGYTGWVSLELFSRTLNDEGAHVPRTHAERGMESWKRTAVEMGWEWN